MNLAYSRSEMNSTEKSQAKPSMDIVAATDEGIKRLKRARRLRVLFPRLERLCKPQSENFWVLGGRPGSFKTGLLWNLALNMASLKQKVLFVSLEMTPGEISILGVAKFSGLTRDRIEAAMVDGTQEPFTHYELQKWETGLLAFGELMFSMRIHGADLGRNVDDIIRSATQHRYDAVFVDHLGMIGRDSNARELDVLALAVHRLRGLTRGEVVKDYHPWVVATSQLNREIDKGDEDRVPKLSDFRGSARIEHDADVAIGLQKRRKAESEGSPSVLDAFVLKNRNGPEPTVLSFEANGATGMITERHTDPAPPKPFNETEEDD